MSEMWYTYWLACVEGITGDRKCELCRKNGSAEAVYYIEEKGIREQIITEKEWGILKEVRKKGIGGKRIKKWWTGEFRWQSGDRTIIRNGLKNLRECRMRLFLSGRCHGRECVGGSVGARRCSSYGEKMTLRFVERLAESGIQIISGMARGIDAEGHKGALDTDTPTFAVLGSGVDVCYPNSNRWLYQRILEKGGGIISELPPGSPPVNWAFPARNRIISGLPTWCWSWKHEKEAAP